jgi:predicted ABC-type ATPase
VGSGKTTFYEAYLKEAIPTQVSAARERQKPHLNALRSFAVEDIRVDLQLLDEAKAAGYTTRVLFISTEDADLNVGRISVRVSRGGQAEAVSTVIDSYREATKNLAEVRNHADELFLYDNTAHGRGFRVVAHFTAGELSKAAQTIPDWASKVFGKELLSKKQYLKTGRSR